MVVTLGAMMILNFANVVSRYLLSTSIAFTEELTTNLFVWSCFIGAAAAAKRGAHLGFSLVVDSMPRLARRWVAVLVTLLTLGMFGIMFVLSLDMIETQIMLKQGRNGLDARAISRARRPALRARLPHTVP